MKKKIIIVGLTLIGLIFAFNSNSWAAGGRGDHRHHDHGKHQQRWNKPSDHHYHRKHERGHWFKYHHYQPVHRFGPKHYKQHYHPHYRFGPRHYKRHHRPFYRPHYHKRFHRHHHRPVYRIINNYYGNVESDPEPENQYLLSAFVSDTGFSFAMGVSGLD